MEGCTICGNKYRFNYVYTLSSTGEAEIAFSVEYTSADSNEVTVSPTTRSLVFSAGQTLAEITASVIDDGLPEETEEIRFQLTETTGALLAHHQLQ